MIGRMRARGFAAAFLMLASLFSVPAAAATSVPAPQNSEELQAAVAAAPADVVATPAAPARPLRDLVISHVDYGNRDAEQDCLVKAIYFEARSESLEGQLAVA